MKKNDAESPESSETSISLLLDDPSGDGDGRMSPETRVISEGTAGREARRRGRHDVGGAASTSHNDGFMS